MDVCTSEEKSKFDCKTYRHYYTLILHFIWSSSIKDSESNIRTLPKKSMAPIEIFLIIALTLYSNESNTAEIVSFLCHKDNWNTYFRFKFHRLLQLFWITCELHCQKRFRIFFFHVNQTVTIASKHCLSNKVSNDELKLQNLMLALMYQFVFTLLYLCFFWVWKLYRNNFTWGI